MEKEFNKELLEKITELGDRDFELMLLDWCRYARGRRSYIVSTCTNYVAKLLPNLSYWCLNNLESDFEDYAKDAETGLNSGWGDDSDKDSWGKLWDSLIIEMHKRKEYGQYS